MNISRTALELQKRRKREIRKNRATLALEVLIKFDNQLRECPFLMPEDIEQEEKKVFSYSNQHFNREFFVFEVYEAEKPAPPKVVDLDKLKEELLENAKR